MQPPIMFIHGFGKSSEDWKGLLAQWRSVIKVDLTDADYRDSCTNVTERLRRLVVPNLTIVAHSQGGFYALKLAETSSLVSKLLLIDPTAKTVEYYDMLMAKDDDISRAKIKHWEDWSTGQLIPARVVVRIHLNVTADTKPSLLEYWHKLVNKNTKSRLIVHYQVGHMLHRKITATIGHSLRELVKC